MPMNLRPPSNAAERSRYKRSQEQLLADARELADLGPQAGVLPQHHAAIVKSARANAKAFGAAIRAYDQGQAAGRKGKAKATRRRKA